MKCFAITLIFSLLLLPLAARADGPDDQYVEVYSLIQVGDSLAEKGDNAGALARYNEAQDSLKHLQTAYPSWNVNLVNYRLKYLATKISAIPQAARAAATPAVPGAETVTTPPPAKSVETATSPVVAAVPTPSAESEKRIQELQEQIQHMTADKSLLEAKLKEALAARPAAVDPAELAKAQEQIKGLQKENEALKATVAEAKTNIAPAGTSRETLRESLAEANRKVAQLTEANASLTSEKNVLQTQAKAAVAPDSSAQALRDENALLKKQLADLKSRGAVASPNEALSLKLKEAEAQVAALQSDEQILRLEKIALETRVKQLSTLVAVVGTNSVSVPTNTVAAVTNVVPANTNVAMVPALGLDSVTASRLAQLEAQRDELQKSLEAATRDIAGRKKGKLLATQIDEMTRQLAGLRARIDVYETRQIPYTPDEMAMLGKPEASILFTAHESNKRQAKELPSGAALLVAEAQRYYVAHELDKAEQKYLEILKLDEKNVTTLADLASIQLDEGHVADAEKSLKAALAVDPNDDHCLYIFGRLKYQQQNYDEAFNYLSRAAQIAPTNAKVQNFLGLALSGKGQRGPAETAFRKAIQLDPGFADAHLNLAVVYATQQPPLLELARWHYQKALAAGHPANARLEALLDPTKSASVTP